MEDQMSTSSRAQESFKLSRKTYKTLAPNPLDSIGVPVVNAYAAPDSMSVSTICDSDGEITWHDGKSQLGPDDLLSPEEDWEKYGMRKSKKCKFVSGVSIT